MAFTRVLGPGIHTASNINSHNINSTGIITAVSFVGDGSSLTGIANTDFIVGTAITMGTGNFTGNLTVGGVLTYEDVKNVDSIGVVTARDGIKVGTGITFDTIGDAEFCGIVTFNNRRGSVAAHFPNNEMLVFGNSYLYGNIRNTGAELTFDALNKYRFNCWDGNSMEQWMGVSGTSGAITLGGYFMGTGSGRSPRFQLQGSNHLIKMFSSEPGSTTLTERFSLSQSGINFTGLSTHTGNFDLDGDLDVDGHTNLDNLSIAGINTIGSQNNTLYSPHTSSWAVRSAMTLLGNYGGGLAFNDNNNNGFVHYVDTSGQNFYIKNAAVGATPKTSIKCVKDGAVELHHNNTKRLETSSVGVSIPQDLDVDGHTNLDNVNIVGVTTTNDDIKILTDNKSILFGASSDLSMKHDGTNSYILNNTGNFILSADTLQFNNRANNETKARFVNNGAAELYHDGTLRFETSNTGVSLSNHSYTLITGAMGSTENIKITNTTSGGYIQIGLQQMDSDGLHHRAYIKASKGSANIAGKLELLARGSGGGTNRGWIIDAAVGIQANQQVLPETDSTYDLGSSSKRWSNLYADTLYGDGSNLTGISAGTSLSGSTNNTVCTVTGANAIQGESNLTFDGTKLNITTNGAGFRITRNSQYIELDGNFGNGGDQTLATSAGFRIQTGGVGNSYEKLRITSGGNIGINENAPSEKLQIDGDILLGGQANSSESNYAIKFEYNNHQFAKIVGDGRDSSGYGDIDFYTSTGSGVSNLTQRMSIRADGKIGIGNFLSSSPSAAVHIDYESNNLLMLDSTTGSTQKMFFAQNGGTHAQIYGTSASGALTIESDPSNNHGSSYMNFRVDGGESLRIDSSRRVLIGTTSGSQGQVSIFNGNDFSTASISNTTDNIFLISDATSGNGVYGASIGFSRVQYADRRAAAIATVQEGSDEDNVGLAFFTHPAANATDPIVEALRISSSGHIIPGTNNSKNIGDGTTNFASIWASTRFRGNDDVKLVLGNSQDLVIRHDGNNNLIESPQGHNLYIKSGTGDNANINLARFNHAGSSFLYWNGNLRLTTTSTGVDIDGTGALKVPVGTTAQRPTGSQGMLRVNTTSKNLELYGNTGWVNVASTEELGTSTNPAKSGKVLYNLGKSSGNYYIKPDGYTGSAIECYVDMTTHGGGWVLVASYTNHSGFEQSSNTGGLNQSSVKSYATSKPPNGNTRLLPKDFINYLAHQNTTNGSDSDYSIMGVHGRSGTGYVHWEVKANTSNRNSSFDFFKVMYRTQDANNNMDVKIRQETSTSSTTDYVGKSISGSYSNYTQGRGGTSDGNGSYHYLIDDYYGGYEWCFRENVDDIPGSFALSVMFIR